MLNDYSGNVLATVSDGVANWNPIRVSGYGPVNGYQAAALSPGVPLAETLVWRTRRVDPSGFFYLGARYYDGTSGRFLSPDPLGHSASMDLYSFADGDPLNNFDADGRFVSGGLNGVGQWGSQMYAGMGNALDSVLHSIVSPWNPLAATRNFSGGYEADFRYQRNFEQGSAAYQLGHNAGYAGAEIGFQVAMFAGPMAFGRMASGAAAGGGMGAAAGRMGGAMSYGITRAQTPIVSLQAPMMTGNTLSGPTKLPATTTTSSGGTMNIPQPAAAPRGVGALYPRNALLSPMNSEIGGSLPTGGGNSTLHKNANAYVGPQSVYEIRVNGELLKYGKADMTQIAKSGLPVRLESQLNRIRASNPSLDVEGRVLYQHPNISTKDIKRVETRYIQDYYDQHGILPPRNQGHPGIVK